MWVAAVFWSFVGFCKIAPTYICISCKPVFMFWGKIDQICAAGRSDPAQPHCREDHWPTFADFVHFYSSPISDFPQPIFYCWHMKIHNYHEVQGASEPWLQVGGPLGLLPYMDLWMTLKTWSSQHVVAPGGSRWFKWRAPGCCENGIMSNSPRSCQVKTVSWPVDQGKSPGYPGQVKIVYKYKYKVNFAPLLYKQRKSENFYVPPKFFYVPPVLFYVPPVLFYVPPGLFFGVLISLTILTMLDHPNDYRRSS